MSTLSDIQHIIEELSDVDLVQGLSNLLGMAEGVIPENINDMTHELIKRYIEIKWPSRRDPSDYGWEYWEVIENSKLEINTNEDKSKMMVCPFCGQKRMCQLRFGQIEDKKIPYYICLDCERMKI